jgi:hypothetical protein
VLDSPELAERLGAAGRRRVLDRYTWRSTAERTAGWYGEVLDRKASMPTTGEDRIEPGDEAGSPC